MSAGTRCVLCGTSLDVRMVGRQVRSSHQRMSDHGYALPREIVTRAVKMKPVQVVFGVARIEGSLVQTERGASTAAAEGVRMATIARLTEAHARICLHCVEPIAAKLAKLGPAEIKLSDALRVLGDALEAKGL